MSKSAAWSRCTHGLIGADEERAEPVGFQLKTLVVEAKHDALRANQRLGPEQHRASADHFGADSAVQPVRRQTGRRRQADESEAFRADLLGPWLPAGRQPRRA